MLQVRALKNIIAKREIHDAGEIFEIDEVTGYKLEGKGAVEVVVGGTAAVEPELRMTAGLPSLDEEAQAKRKKK